MECEEDANLSTNEDNREAWTNRYEFERIVGDHTNAVDQDVDEEPITLSGCLSVSLSDLFDFEGTQWGAMIETEAQRGLQDELELHELLNFGAESGTDLDASAESLLTE